MAVAAEILVNSLKNGFDMLKIGRNPTSIIKGCEPADDIFDIPAFHNKFSELNGWKFLSDILFEMKPPIEIIKKSNFLKLISSEENERFIIENKFWRALHFSQIFDNGYIKVLDKEEPYEQLGIKYIKFNTGPLRYVSDRAFHTTPISNYIPDIMWNNSKIRKEIISDPEMFNLIIPDVKISDFLNLQSQINELKELLIGEKEKKEDDPPISFDGGAAAGGGGAKDKSKEIEDFGRMRSISIIHSTKMPLKEYRRIVSSILMEGSSVVFINDKLNVLIKNDFCAYEATSGIKKLGNVIYINEELIIIR